jgi:hypothetical protein
MLPLEAAPMMHRVALQAAALIAVSVVAAVFNAVVGPLSGLPCCVHVVPSLVPTTVPIAPPAKQYELVRHAMPVSACVLELGCVAQFEPPFTVLTRTALPAVTAPAA